jgi:hypothetical protein
MQASSVTAPLPVAARSDDDDLAHITTEQVDALGAMLFRPRQYVQRIIERMSFLPEGQHWKRDIQLRIPSSLESEVDEGKRFYVVSLGMFDRKRFPDFAVTNSDGNQCALLTRRQHGFCLTTCMMRQFLDMQEWEASVKTENGRRALAGLYTYLATMLTTIPASDAYTGDGAAKKLKALFGALGIEDKHRRRRAFALLKYSCYVLEHQTQYLCWVQAEPGALIRLSAEYTTADSPLLFKADFIETDSPSSLRLSLRNARMRWYSRYRLMPMHYRIYVPSNAQCGSYYFMIKPPADTKISLLEWGSGRRFHIWTDHEDSGQLREIDSAAFSCHMHNGGGPRRFGRPPRTAEPSEIQSSRLHAFVRSAPYDHDKLIAASLLSLLLALLAQDGTFALLGQGQRNQWLLLAPAAILVFIGQQQRHHYGRFTRPFRWIMWIYISVAAVFAGTEALVAHGAIPEWLDGNTGNGIVTAALALMSVTFVILFTATGKRFDRTAEKRFDHILSRVREFGTPSWLQSHMSNQRSLWATHEAQSEDDLFGDGGRHPADRIYAAVGRHRIDRALLRTVAVWLFGIALVLFGGWGSGRQAVIDEQASEVRATMQQREDIAKVAQALGRRTVNATNTKQSVCRAVVGCLGATELGATDPAAAAEPSVP